MERTWRFKQDAIAQGEQVPHPSAFVRTLCAHHAPQHASCQSHRLVAHKFVQLQRVTGPDVRATLLCQRGYDASADWSACTIVPAGACICCFIFRFAHMPRVCVCRGGGRSVAEGVRPEAGPVGPVQRGIHAQRTPHAHGRPQRAPGADGLAADAQRVRSAGGVCLSSRPRSMTASL